MNNHIIDKYKKSYSTSCIVSSYTVNLPKSIAKKQAITRLNNFHNYLEFKINKLTLSKRSFIKIDEGDFDANGIKKANILIYYSYGNEINLNCKVFVKNQTINEHKIVCRHFAIAYLTNSINFTEINTLHKISNYPCFKDIDQFSNYCSQSAQFAYYFRLINLFKILKMIAEDIKNNKPQKCNSFLFCSTNHVMVIKINYKSNKWIIYFYDPNDTLRHKKFIVHTTTDILRFKLHNFFNLASINLYFPEEIPSACLLSLNTTKEEDCIIHIDKYMTPSIGYLMLYWGHFSLISQDLLNANYFVSASGIHGLCFALYYERYASVKSYIDILDKSNLTVVEKYNNLRMYNYGKPQLLHLIKEEKIKTIEIYITAILTTSLPDIYKYMLINAQDKYEISALEHAILTANLCLIEKYMQLILENKLSCCYKIKLLLVAYNKLLNIQNREISKSKVIAAFDFYFSIIANSKLSLEQKKYLTCELI